MRIDTVTSEAPGVPLAKAQAEVAQARRLYEDLCKRSRPLFAELHALSNTLEHAEDLTEVELMAASAHRVYLEAAVKERSAELDEAFAYLRGAEDRLEAMFSRV